MKSTRRHTLVFFCWLLVLLSFVVLVGACGPAIPTTELPVGATKVVPTATWPPTPLPAATPTLVPTSLPTPARDTIPSATEVSVAPIETTGPLTTELQSLVAGSLPPTPTPEADGSSLWGPVEIGILPLEVPEGDVPLWAAFSKGMGFYDMAEGPFVAVYTNADEAWQELGRVVLTDCAEYVGNEALRQVQVEPSRAWLEMETYTGAHSGCYDLLSFDGEVLRREVGHFNSSPGAGQAADLDGDGLLEVILNWTENYVFCYACGVRLPMYDLLRWDGEALVAVNLTPLPESASADLRLLHDRAVELAQAGLWQDAQALMTGLLARDIQDPRFADTVKWNRILIEIHAEALAEQVSSDIYPLLSNVFYGDYSAAVNNMRSYSPAEIWTLDTPLIAGTVAEGWELALSDWISWTSDLALGVLPEPFGLPPSEQTRAAAYFLRSWASFLRDPGDPAFLVDVKRAVRWAPDDPLFAASLAYLLPVEPVGPSGLTGIYEPLPPQACFELGQAMMQTLNLTVTIQEEPFEDYVGGDTGTGCQLATEGTGLDFSGAWTVADELRAMLFQRGWEEDIVYLRDSPNGTAAGFWRGEQLCLLSASWRLADCVECPDDRPIWEVGVEPEHQLYDIWVHCAQAGGLVQPTPQATPTPIPTPVPAAEERWEVRTLLAGPGSPGRLYALLTDALSSGWPAWPSRFLISDDYGATWTPFPGGLPAQECVLNVNLDYAQTDALWASTCHGLYRWTGSEWRFVSPQVTDMVSIVYGQPETMWATESFADGAGVMRSDDGGLTWTLAGNGLISFNGVANVGIDPRDANTLYAVIWPAYAGSYLRRGTAAGQWQTMPTPQNNLTIDTGITIDGASGALYVVSTSQDTKLWRTLNPSTSNLNDVQWELVHDFGRDLRVSLLASGWGPEGLALYASIWPLDWQDESMALVGDLQLHRSLDGGQTWVPLPLP